MRHWRNPSQLVAMLMAFAVFFSSGSWAFAQAVFTPKTQSVRVYGQAVTVPQSPIAWSITALAAQLSDTWTRPRPVLDGPLSRTAQTLARMSAAGGRHARQAIEFAGGHAGVMEPVSVVLAIRTNRTEEAAIAQALRDGLNNAIGLRSFNRIGVGQHRDGETGTTIVVVALTERYAELKPIPVQLKSGDETRIIGQLVGQYQRPQIFVTGPDGEARDVELTVANAQFSAPLKCRSHGVYRMEIIAESDAGPVVLVNVPIYCGISAPSATRLITDEVERMDQGEAEKRIFALINRARSRSGRPPLISHDGAVEVARRHSADMRDHRFVAHVSKRTGSVEDRVKSASIPVTWLAENVGLADSPYSVHEGLMASPGHRAAILTDEASHVGIGVAYDGDGDLLVTQVFLKPRAPLNAHTARKSILQSIRAFTGGRRVDVDPVMDDVAEAMAAAYAQGEQNQQQLSTEATRRLQAAELLSYGGFRVLVGTTRQPTKLLTAAQVQPDSITGLGVGVAIGRGSKSDGEAYFVVVLLGTK